jgi:hypothetical protein
LPAGAPIFGPIALCIASPGPNAFGIYLGDVVGDGSGVYPLDPTAGPVLVAPELHVVDTGKFDVRSDQTRMKGRISVTVDSSGGVTTGPILITKSEAEFGVKGKKGHP